MLYQNRCLAAPFTPGISRIVLTAKVAFHPNHNLHKMSFVTILEPKSTVSALDTETSEGKVNRLHHIPRPIDKEAIGVSKEALKKILVDYKVALYTKKGTGSPEVMYMQSVP